MVNYVLARCGSARHVSATQAPPERKRKASHTHAFPGALGGRGLRQVLTEAHRPRMTQEAFAPPFFSLATFHSRSGPFCCILGGGGRGRVGLKMPHDGGKESGLASHSETGL